MTIYWYAPSLRINEVINCCGVSIRQHSGAVSSIASQLLDHHKNLPVGELTFVNCLRCEWLYAWCPAIEWCLILSIFLPHPQCLQDRCWILCYPNHNEAWMKTAYIVLYHFLSLSLLLHKLLLTYQWPWPLLLFRSDWSILMPYFCIEFSSPEINRCCWGWPPHGQPRDQWDCCVLYHIETLKMTVNILPRKAWNWKTGIAMNSFAIK